MFYLCIFCVAQFLCTSVNRLRKVYIRGTTDVWCSGAKAREVDGQGQKGDSEYMGRMILRLKLPGMRLVGVRMQRIGCVGWREMIGHR